MTYKTYGCTPSDSIYSRDVVESLALTTIGPDDNLRPEVFTVLDARESRMYNVVALTAIDAIKSYLDWCYGKVEIYEWDMDEMGYCGTNEYVPASSVYDIEEEGLDWELVMG